MSQSKKKNAVLIKWKTKDHWCDREQYVKRGSIDPEDSPLEKGQRVKVLFSRKWYDAVVSEAWIVETQKTRPRKCKNNFTKWFSSRFLENEFNMVSFALIYRVCIKQEKKTLKSPNWLAIHRAMKIRNLWQQLKPSYWNLLQPWKSLLRLRSMRNI